jgi:hypothetical protein
MPIHIWITWAPTSWTISPNLMQVAAADALYHG